MSKYGIWCMFFASLVAIRLHPRNFECLGVVGEDEPDPRFKDEVVNCAHIADVMLRISENRLKDDDRGYSS